MKLLITLLGCAALAACDANGQETYPTDVSHPSDARSDVAPAQDVVALDAGGGDDASDAQPDTIVSDDVVAMDTADAAPTDPCAAARTCGACVVVSGCGYCTTTSSCATANADDTGSADGTCTGGAWETTTLTCVDHGDAGVHGDAGGSCTSNADCDGLDYCQPLGSGVTGTSTCGAPGHCAARPASCSGPMAMVCGCDGAEYPSTCAALMAGVPVHRIGACLMDGGARDAEATDAHLDPLPDGHSSVGGDR